MSTSPIGSGSSLISKFIQSSSESPDLSQALKSAAEELTGLLGGGGAPGGIPGGVDVPGAGGLPELPPELDVFKGCSGFELPGSQSSSSTPALSTPPMAGAEAISGQRSTGVADRTVEIAKSEDDSINPSKRGEDGKVKGWQHLQDVFEKTTGWRPSDKECQTVNENGSVKPGGASWCGIWATHVLQEAGCDVKWKDGQMVGDVSHVMAPKFSDPASYKAERQAFEQSIKPGDVITLAGPQNHHAIVTKVNDDGTVETMDGNKPHVGPGHQKLKDVTSYYRPNGD